MCDRNVEDFLTHYRILCSQSKVCPLKTVQKLIHGTEFCCPVEALRKEHWPLVLETLQTDNSLSKIEFSCNLSHSSQQQTSKKKQKIMDKYFPVPYGCTAPNVSALIHAVGMVVGMSLRLTDVRLENLCLSKEDVASLAECLSIAKIKVLSFADCQIDDESLDILSHKIYDTKISWLNFSSCRLSGERLRSVCRLIKFSKTRRAKDMYVMGLRNQIPVLDEMKGLTRITLNNNNFGDEGVQMIMEHLEDDLWIKVLDFQKCGIGNEGAKSLLNSLKSNVTFQAIDLRLNNIDESYLEKISLQLSLNNAGKELQLKLGPLWQPRKLTIRTPRRRIMKTNVLKLTPPKVQVLKKPTATFVNPFENAVKFSRDMLNLKYTGLEDASSQTEDISIDEDLKRMQKSLSNEIKLRECLMHLLKKYKMENCILRKEIQKLSKLDDHILIDHETYFEVKNTFEKFKRFLNVMKEYGLFECIAMLGVHQNTDIVLKPMIVNATKKCLQLVENEPSSTTSASETVDVPVSNENIKLQTDEVPNSGNWYPCQTPDIQAALNKNGTSTCYNQEQKEHNHVKKPAYVDKALVQRVYREVRENYSNSSHSGHPSFPPKLIARRPEMPVRKKPKSNSKNSVMKDISKIEATHKLKNTRVPKEFYNAVAKDADQRDACEVQNSLSFTTSERSTGIHALAHKNVSSQTPSSSAVNSSAQSVSSTKTDPDKLLDKTSMSRKSSTSDSSTLLETDSNVTDPRCAQKVPPNARPKLKVATKSGKSVCTNSPLVTSISEKDANSILGSTNPALSEPSAAGSAKTSVSAESAVKEKLNSNALASNSARVAPCSSSGSARVAPCSSSSSARVAPCSSSGRARVAPCSSSSSVESYNSQEGVEKPLHSSSDGKSDFSKSYLESVSDASTDKDVKSLAESEVYSTASTEKGSKNPSESSIPAKKVEQVNVASSECRDHSKSSKSSKKKKSKKLSPQITLTQDNLKKTVSDSSVPSLSDITTVSSHSLNTDSVLGQLSNDES